MVTKTQFGHIRPHGLEEEMRSSYLTYAMTVIVGRALPDVRDGLKARSASNPVRGARDGDASQLIIPQERKARG